jgi:hypothetical protein
MNRLAAWTALVSTHKKVPDSRPRRLHFLAPPFRGGGKQLGPSPIGEAGSFKPARHLNRNLQPSR